MPIHPTNQNLSETFRSISTKLFHKNIPNFMNFMNTFCIRV